MAEAGGSINQLKSQKNFYRKIQHLGICYHNLANDLYLASLFIIWMNWRAILPRHPSNADYRTQGPAWKALLIIPGMTSEISILSGKKSLGEFPLQMSRPGNRLDRTLAKKREIT